MIQVSSPAVILTAHSMAELRARAKAQGRTIVEASYSRLCGWTARTEPARTALSRTYTVNESDTFTGYAWSGTVTLSSQSGVLTGAINGVPCAFGAAAARLDTCTYLRLTDEQLATHCPVPSTSAAAQIGGAA
ncbi:hypothetical protein GO986_08835 [Deinococcus sp. HMF7620]|uniref:Uncharacterized protein n=1 Tax=Deinococcus arboris TaxID=2682977 RepID=A0A7C9HYC1_9DEIO|nr:hypothetical protein [Deinococcus arboris]MVN86868.1 hypothetical protein [Deinococcus arboris]